MFQGQYMGKEYHPPDLHQVLERAWSAGMVMLIWLNHRQGLTPSHLCVTGLQKFIVTAGSLPESRAALQLAQSDGKHHTA